MFWPVIAAALAVSAQAGLYTTQASTVCLANYASDTITWEMLDASN